MRSTSITADDAVKMYKAINPFYKQKEDWKEQTIKTIDEGILDHIKKGKSYIEFALSIDTHAIDKTDIRFIKDYYTGLGYKCDVSDLKWDDHTIQYQILYLTLSFSHLL